MSFRGRGTEIALRKAIIYGFGAYLLGYVVTFLLVFQQEGSTIEGLETDLWHLVWRIFYGSHGVIENTLSWTRMEGTYNLLYLIPPLLLVVSGFLVARSGGVTGLRGSIRAGVTVVVSYFALALVGALVMFYTGGSSPDILGSVLVVGLLYPILFGGVGGIFAHYMAGRYPGVLGGLSKSG
ncbi:MAG: hypothetical protein SV377_03445 [Halobacteria archaeon]|nr:hypothetical protein [Halobacteria archaeon]